MTSAKDVALCLLFKGASDYHMKTYFIEGVEMIPSLKKRTYPKYYDFFMDRIGTFVKVSPWRGSQPTLDQLYVHSSLNKLRDSLRRSLRGHFLCKSWR